LNRVPAEARIAIVTESQIATAVEVREKFRRVKPLGEITVGRRCCAAPILGQSGSSAPPCWTLDVLNAIRRLGKTQFTTADAYAFTRELEKLHPDT
jgi:Dam-replacing HTH domain